MKFFRREGLIAAVVTLLGLVGASAQANGNATVSVQVDQPGVAVSPNLFGVFFEEINCAGDGGLYAELVRNRSFEEPTHDDSWQFVTTGAASGQMAPDDSLPLSPSNTWALRLTQSASGGTVGVANGGFWGMNFQTSRAYDLSLYARGESGFAGGLSVRLENAAGSQVLAQRTITGLTTNWQRFALSLTPASTDPAGRLVVALSQPGTVWLDMVSLFPHATFRERTNGLRPDLGNLLADLTPGFVRFPGGCWVEGEWMTNAYRWKTTIGDPANRATKWNLWQYYSNNGLGYHEYLQLCEDLGADALFVINCGMSHNDTIPLAQMDEFVQDALDAIEYANGPTNTMWGARRAANGHPAPFKLRYVEIGNENGGSAYNDRYALFYDAIKAAHPEIQLVACVWGGTPTSRPLEIIDEHYYNNPAFFIANATRYDGYSRSGPKIYVGEYAVTSGSGNGNLAGALGEASFMTGMERNADIVVMSSYAPLFANLNYKRWNPDLIYFDSSRVAPTPSYHVQKLFAENRGDVVLPASVRVTLPSDAEQQTRGAVGLGSWNTSVEYTNLVVTSNGVTLYQSDFAVGATGWREYGGNWNTSGGLYRQTAIATDCRSTTGDGAWANYTITLRARKVSGNEGFLILFNWLDDANFTWWNLGGWNNSLHAIEYSQNGSKSIVGSQVAGQIETGRWYEIRIELDGRQIRCYLDGALVHDVQYPAAKHGAIGLGTWNTSASFTNVAVTKADQTLYQSDFSSGASGWTVYRGSWSATGGRYRQTSTSTTDCRSTTGSTTWSDYTLSLKARKDGGSEGFLIMFDWLDDDNFTWWNIGGWGNTRHAIEVCENGAKSTLGDSVTGSLNTGQWYDIRVELSGGRIRCYLDNALIHEVSYPVLPPLHVSASYHEASGQVIIKAVNVSAAPIESTFSMMGVSAVTPNAVWALLTSASVADENTLDQPAKVSPIINTLTNAGTNFTHTLPANSLTVLRLQTPPTQPARLSLGCGTNLTNIASFPNGLPVRLASFITNAVLVGYTIEAADGAVVTNGTVQFRPGDLLQHIPLPAAAFLRVTLHNPAGAVLDGVTRGYLGAPANSGEPLRINAAHFADESVLYWTDAAAQLQSAVALEATWTTMSNPPPVRLDFGDSQRFYRLRR